MKRKSTKQSGNSLAVMMFVVILVTGVLFVFLKHTTAEFKSQHLQRDSQQALWQANGQLQLAMNIINNSTYDANGRNNVLLQNADTGQPISGTNVTLTSVSGSTTWYTLHASATVGSTTHVVRMLVRGRDTFSRFGIFTGNHPVGLGDITTGDVHTNKYLEIYFPGSVFNGNVSAHEGFRYVAGATATNTHFMGSTNQAADIIAMPAVQDMLGYASGVYYQNNTNDVEITLEQNRIHIKVKNGINGQYDLPVSGVIYVKGKITKLDGSLCGRLTIVSEQSITISQNLQYVDANNRTAYLNGTRHDAPFIPNPAYTGDSSLGIIANGNIDIDRSVPAHVEIDAVMYSKTGHIGMAGYTLNAGGTGLTGYDSSFHKQGVRYLGSIISAQRPVDQICNGSGQIIAGFDYSQFTYDNNSFIGPPPHFLTVQRPQYMGWEVER
jgi:hypothetical protein